MLLLNTYCQLGNMEVHTVLVVHVHVNVAIYIYIYFVLLILLWPIIILNTFAQKVASARYNKYNNKYKFIRICMYQIACAEHCVDWYFIFFSIVSVQTNILHIKKKNVWFFVSVDVTFYHVEFIPHISICASSGMHTNCNNIWFLSSHL